VAGSLSRYERGNTFASTDVLWVSGTRVRRGVRGVREVLVSIKTTAPSLVGLMPLRTLIVLLCLVNMKQSVPSDMVSLEISRSTGRSAPPNDVEALGGAYLAPGMWEMRRGGFAGGPAILERGYA
jgi:hypothetical protein